MENRNDYQDSGYKAPEQNQQQVYINRSDLPLKSTPFAVVLSALVPGMGQVYVGYYKHAFLIILLVASVITALASGNIDGMEPLFGIFLGFFYFYQMIDAGRKCSFYNRAVEGKGQSVVDSDLSLPDAGGGKFAGVALLTIGTLAFMRTKFDISMEWVEDWWPLVLIIAGGYILYQSRTESKTTDTDNTE
jgi:cell wall-active antibiotic response 4TMS protein YvqF